MKLNYRDDLDLLYRISRFYLLIFLTIDHRVNTEDLIYRMVTSLINQFRLLCFLSQTIKKKHKLKQFLILSVVLTVAIKGDRNTRRRL